VNLGPIVNSTSVQVEPFIAPDGSYLIFTTAHSGDNYYGLYISFNKGNSGWTVPINMNKSGANINILNQGGLSLSPDGNYLFFCRGDNPATGEFWDVYWVSTHILVGLRKYAFAPRLSRHILDMNIKIDSVINYVIPDNTFSCEYGTDSLKYAATLSNGSALPSWLHFDPNTKTLSGTPKQTETDTIKIIAANSDTVSASCLFKITVTNATGVEEDNGQHPKEFMLLQNYPNPFNPATVISYQLPAYSNMKLTIYNILGQKIKTLVNSFQNAGEHSLVWDATDEKSNLVSSGVYFYKLEVGAMNLQKKMMLLR
jgi:hypothetical protein